MMGCFKEVKEQMAAYDVGELQQHLVNVSDLRPTHCMIDMLTCGTNIRKNTPDKSH